MPRARITDGIMPTTDVMEPTVLRTSSTVLVVPVTEARRLLGGCSSNMSLSIEVALAS